MIIEKGVNIVGITSEIVLALVIAESILLRHGQPLVIVEVAPVKPTDRSVHFDRQGVAIRAEASGSENRTAAIAEALGSGYDVEYAGERIYIEFYHEQEAEENAGSDDRELEGAAPEISGTNDSDEGSSGETTVDPERAGAEPDTTGEPTD